TLNSDDFVPGRADEARLNRGDRPGSHWVPAECDVSIRPGWFFHPHEDARVRTSHNLLDLYYSSVGRGASLLLNLAPDRRGQIPAPDVKSLNEFHQLLTATFSKSLSHDARVSASNTRGNARFSPKNVLNDKRDSYWSTDDQVTTAQLILDLNRQMTFNVVRLREHLPLPQRIEAFALDAWHDGDW